MRNHRSYFVRLALVLSILAAATPTYANIITVRQDGSGDFTTITAAIAAAAANDTIEVGPGTYAESADLLIPLTFVSTDGAGATVIDGSGTRHHLWFFNAPGSNVEGFRFVNGYNASGGGSIRVQGGATLNIRDCEFENNTCDFDGGALFARDSGSMMNVENCSFVGNTSGHNGGAGQTVLGADVTYASCTFVQNSTTTFCGAVASHNSTMDVIRCFFRGNSSGDVAGAVYYYGSAGRVENSTFYANTSPGGIAGTIVIQSSTATTVTQNIIAGETDGYGLRYYQSGGTHSCNLYWNNASGPSNVALSASEIVGDPLFCGAATGDFDIAIQSPAAPENNSCGLLFGAFPITCGIVPPTEGPVITSILDVGNDQGRQVRVKWDASLYDAPGDGVDITGYAVYRRQDMFFTTDRKREGASTSDRRGPERVLAGWDYIVTVPARGDESYQYVSPTLCDSTAQGICWSVFFVSALTPDPLDYYDSEPDSGYSIDNIDPDDPEDFAVQYNAPGGNQLSWTSSQTPDFEAFRVYRSTAPDFTIGPENLAYTTPGVAWADANGGAQHYYKLTAMDDAGNESNPVSPGTVTGVGDRPIPDRFTLYQNVPNPFNPTTVIPYDVPANSGVITITVFDVGGRLMRTLVDGAQESGRRTVAWDGRDEQGRKAASGVYFYRLAAPGYYSTLKMTLIE